MIPNLAFTLVDKMASMWTVNFQVASLLQVRTFSDEFQLGSEFGVVGNWSNWNQRGICRQFVPRAISSSDDDRRLPDDAVLIEKLEKDSAEKPQQNVVAKLHASVGSVPVFVLSIGKPSGLTISLGLCFLASILVIVVRGYARRNSSYCRSGSVADLVRRGQIRSDRRGISTPLKYEDPFNNPMVKVSKCKSSVEMCGKVYRLAPVTLTEELQKIHKKRRSRAYNWKRPTIFLKEGESVPLDVNPDTVRWIPANHPFATTSSDIDEDLAQNNVYQKHGVPFRIKAEHEALQRKLEALQNEQKLSKLVIDPAAARDFERPLKLHMNPEDLEENTISNPNLGTHLTPDHMSNGFGKKPSSEEV